MAQEIISGIYRITNIVNSKIYIGSSNDVVKRKREHFSGLKKNRHDNSHLQNSYNKHGKTVFIFDIIEFCEESQNLIREQWYLDNVIKWDFDYNICRKAQGGGGIQNGKLTQSDIEEIFHLHNLGNTNIQIGDKYNIHGSTIHNILNKRLYKRFSNHLIALPTKNNLPKTERNRQIKWLLKYRNATAIGEYFGINKSALLQAVNRRHYDELPCPEILEQIRYNIQGKWAQIPICQYTIEGELINCFDSIFIAAKTFNFSVSNIASCAQGKRNTANKYKWKYKE